MKRDEFTNATKELLAKRVGYSCSRPDCRRPTSGPHSDDTKHVNVGVAAHITAAAKGGPRYDASLTVEQRKAPSNGIWLCQTCAKLIDSDDATYSTKTIRGWKEAAEDAAHAAIENRRSASSMASQIRFAVNEWSIWVEKPEPPNSPIVLITQWAPGDIRFSFKLRIKNESDEEQQLHSMQLEYRNADSVLHVDTYAIQPREIVLPPRKWSTIKVGYGLHSEYFDACRDADAIVFAANIVGDDAPFGEKIGNISLASEKL